MQDQRRHRALRLRYEFDLRTHLCNEEPWMPVLYSLVHHVNRRLPRPLPRKMVAGDNYRERKRWAEIVDADKLRQLLLGNGHCLAFARKNNRFAEDGIH